MYRNNEESVFNRVVKVVGDSFRGELDPTGGKRERLEGRMLRTVERIVGYRGRRVVRRS